MPKESECVYYDILVPQVQLVSVPYLNLTSFHMSFTPSANCLLPGPIRGIIPPLVTPLSALDQLDHAGLERLIEHVLAGGVHGIFILGTTGEGPSLSYRLRRELIERVCAQVAERVPVLVGVTDTAVVESISVAHRAAEAGAAAVVLSAPYYFRPGQPEMLEYLEHLATNMPLPLFLYNMPAHTKVSFGPELVRQVLQWPQIVGLKDSSGQMSYFKQIRDVVIQRRDFSLLMGPEQLLADALAIGAHGGVCGGANLAPRLFVDLYNAVVNGDSKQALFFQNRVRELAAIYSVEPLDSSTIKGIKCALAYMGICDDFMAAPFRRFHEPHREQIRKLLEKSSVLRGYDLQESGR